LSPISTYGNASQRTRHNQGQVALSEEHSFSPRVTDPEVKEHMRDVLTDIQDGTFARRFIADQDAGAPEFLALRAKGEANPIEKVGRELRKLFSWLRQADTEKDYVEGSAGR
jgi:ketol-acid reductoisomerase